MKMLARFSIALVACGFAAAGCAPGPGASPPAVSPAALVASLTPSASPASVLDSANGIAFDRPADWLRWQPNDHNPINDGPLIYLSTDGLLPTCAKSPQTTPNPANAQGRACDWPLAALAPNGVLVTWLTTRILERIPSGGEAIEVNGARTRLTTTTPGACGTIKADETIEVLVPIGQPTPLSNVAVVACLRGPDLARAEAKFRAMLASATVGR
jgi:hypothetical protein